MEDIGTPCTLDIRASNIILAVKRTHSNKCKEHDILDKSIARILWSIGNVVLLNFMSQCVNFVTTVVSLQFYPRKLTMEVYDYAQMNRDTKLYIVKFMHNMRVRSGLKQASFGFVCDDILIHTSQLQLIVQFCANCKFLIVQ